MRVSERNIDRERQRETERSAGSKVSYSLEAPLFEEERAPPFRYLDGSRT